MTRSLLIAPVAFAEFPPIAALSSPWQEHLAEELVTVVRDSVRRLNPRHRRGSAVRAVAAPV